MLRTDCMCWLQLPMFPHHLTWPFLKNKKPLISETRNQCSRSGWKWHWQERMNGCVRGYVQLVPICTPTRNDHSIISFPQTLQFWEPICLICNFTPPATSSHWAWPKHVCLWTLGRAQTSKCRSACMSTRLLKIISTLFTWPFRPGGHLPQNF